MHFDIRLFLGIENGGYVLIEWVDIAEERERDWERERTAAENWEEEEVSNLLDWAVKDL